MSDIQRLVAGYATFYQPRSGNAGRVLPLMSAFNTVLGSSHHTARADLSAMLSADALEWTETPEQHRAEADAFAETVMEWFERYCKGRRDLLRRYRFTVVGAARVYHLKHY